MIATHPHSAAVVCQEWGQEWVTRLVTGTNCQADFSTGFIIDVYLYFCYVLRVFPHNINVKSQSHFRK